MSLYNVYGKEVTNSDYDIQPINQWDGVPFASGYAISYGKLTEDSSSNVSEIKLVAGKQYNIYSNGSQIALCTERQSVADWDTSRNMFSGIWNTLYTRIENGTYENGVDATYIYCPPQDMWLYATYPVNGGFCFVSTPPYYGDVYPLSGGGSWNKYTGDGATLEHVPVIREDVGHKITMPDSFTEAVWASMDVNKLYSSNLHLRFIGDSISWGSGDGLQNAFSRNVPVDLDIKSTPHAVAGTTYTDGYGMEWADGKGTGFTGFMATEPDRYYGIGQAEFTYNDIDLCVVELGTNDFGAGAPLGTIDDEGSATFYGGVKSMLSYLQSIKPTMPIIVITPFKRDNWATANSQNLILPDYIDAIYRVVRQYKHVYILDLFGAWYLDSDNATIKAKAFADNVHPSAWAHNFISEALLEKIKVVAMLEGITGTKS